MAEDQGPKNTGSIRPALAGTIYNATSAPDDAPAPVVTDDPVGVTAAQVDRYVDPRELGEGGMGLISLVRDLRIGRDIALKQLKPHAMTDAPARRRFAREARVQGQLEHPAVVPVYDLGTSVEGFPFFTMKRVRGKSLSEVLELLSTKDVATAEQFSQRRLLTAFSQICLAAHYAHERGVVHRDIKPTNIMLGDYGEVYLLDWGIAKVGNDDGDLDAPRSTIEPADSQLDTKEGTVIGTVGYMAPEQARGDRAALGACTDVYALGAILFEILTYHPLLERSATIELTLAKLVKGVESRPSVRYPDADVPPELDAICVEATRLDPRARLQSARALHEAIEAYLDGDRDLALRRESSRKHAAAAHAATDDVLDAAATPAAETERRAEALNEVGKALALDPTNQAALRTLVRLLTNPPRSVPAEVEQSRDETLRKHIRGGGAAGIAVYTYISLQALVTYSLGIHGWSWGFWAAHALWAGALGASVVTFLRPSYGALFSMFLFGAAASIWVTGVYSPQLMVPMFLAVHAAMYSLIGRPRLRLAVLAIACGGWTLSVFGEHFGLFPSTVRYFDGGIFLSSPVIDFPGFTFSIYLYLAILALIAIPAVVVSKLRASYHSADLQMRLQAWQLGQLVKDGTAHASREA